MQVKTYKTHRIKAGEALLSLVERYIPSLKEKSILAITTKIVSLSEKSVVPKKSVFSKTSLIQNSADAYLEQNKGQLTIKNDLLLPFAGIDESNGEEMYVLYPKNVQQSAKEVWEFLQKRDSLSDLGVLIVDSHLIPLRRGTVGIGLGWYGFQPLPIIIIHIYCITNKISHIDAALFVTCYTRCQTRVHLHCACEDLWLCISFIVQAGNSIQPGLLPSPPPVSRIV